MKKKISVILAMFLAFAMLLAACTSPPGGVVIEVPGLPELLELFESPTVTPRATPTPAAPGRQGERGAPARGVWEGDVYTNETLGLRFTPPDDWFVATDAEIAELMGFGVDMLAGGSDAFLADILDAADLTIFHEMMAASPTGSNVQIMFERLVFPQTRLTEAQYLESVEGDLAWAGIRVDVSSPGPTRIGGYDWYSYGTAIDMLGGTVYGRQFFTIREGFIRLIIFTYFEGSESLEEMLAMFGGLDEMPGEADEEASEGSPKKEMP